VNKRFSIVRENRCDEVAAVTNAPR
jgi:hypothetical protein